jgi:hypothetical protein
MIPENLDEIVRGLQEAVMRGLIATRKRFDKQDAKIRALEERVDNLETCVAHFIERLNGEAK